VEAQEGEEAAYRAAYELVKGREFDDAAAAFNEFLSDYPFGRYAPNAHYWLGELYLVLEPPDPELARQNFKLLLDQYPADPKVPDALYKLGRVQFIKGNRQRSQEYLDEVIREYPSHAAAQLARQFLLENF
jgi:tol-pal system protein YbgF